MFVLLKIFLKGFILLTEYFVGSTFGIPDTVMGLTFIAAGVSVPDALSGIAVIKEGHGMHTYKDKHYISSLYLVAK